MNKWLLLILALLLSGCGFHLKGTSVFDQAMPYQRWKIEGGSMQKPLETVLRHQPNVEVDETNTDITVKVISANESKTTSAVDLSGDTAEYLLTLEVNVQAYRHGDPLGDPIRVVVTRYMDYSDHEVLAKENEERLVWRDIRQDAAEQLVRRLAYLPVEP
ncbi:LPS assembly lipoprotein LptE [Neisseriaceae bacterium ESL0693]|nr:LPS assembly lipoprotein LptE [Neisseriaceae bacterium ESL0693]